MARWWWHVNSLRLPYDTMICVIVSYASCRMHRAVCIVPLDVRRRSGPSTRASTVGQHESDWDEDDDDSEAGCGIELPPWPLYVAIYGCNVVLADAIPEDQRAAAAAAAAAASGKQADPHSPNPFLRSIMSIVEDPGVRQGVVCSPGKLLANVPMLQSAS